jgi:hypothetical protein
MKGTYLILLRELMDQTATIWGQYPEPILAANECLRLVNACIPRLHALIDQHGFEDQNQETSFFKEIRSQIDGSRIYYMQLIHVETACKLATDKTLVYRRYLQKVESFYERNKDFYLYHILSQSHLDNYYYTRETDDSATGIDDDAPLYCDHRYYARMSYKSAMLHSCMLLHHYLQEKFAILGKNISEPVRVPKDILQWTASKAALGELLYALQEYGVFNNTKVEIKKIADYLGKAFDVDLVNIYKIYEDMRLRKKSRTPFLDALRNSLLRRMDLDDENAL